MTVVSVNAVVQVLRFDFCMIELLHSVSLTTMKMIINESELLKYGFYIITSFLWRYKTEYLLPMIQSNLNYVHYIDCLILLYCLSNSIILWCLSPLMFYQLDDWGNFLLISVMRFLLFRITTQKLECLFWMRCNFFFQNLFRMFHNTF